MNLQVIKETATFLKHKGYESPEIGVILGTGLGKLVEEIDVEISLPYADVPNFPLATVEFHSGNLIFGTLKGKKVVAMQGRFHYYEGYSMEEIVFPVRVMKELGITTLLVSNAAGAINLDFKKGDLMLITDHVNLFPSNPLMGPNDNEIGTRFPDMSEPYDLELNDKMRSIAKNLSISLNEGVYISAQGPMLETPAEYRMLRKLGGDAVGMSTIPEVIAANHMNLRCMAVSVLTDECDPDNLEPVLLEDIIAIAAKAEVKLIELMKGLVENI